MTRHTKWINRLKAAAIGIGLALSALTVRHWYGTFMVGHPPCADCRADFPGFYTAARLIWQAPDRLYAYDDQLAIQKTIDGRIGNSILPFAYPPFTAMVLMPLGWLSFRSAFIAMTLANGLLLAAILRSLFQRLDLGKEGKTWLLLSAFCNAGVHTVMLQGQTSLMLLFVLTGFMLSMSRQKDSAGFWAGMVFLKPQLLAVPFIALFFQRRWRAFLIATMVLATLCALSVLVVGTGAIAEYLGLLQFYGTTESGFGSYPKDMHNLRALVQYLVAFEHARYLWLGLVAPIGISAMWMNTRARGEAAWCPLWIGNFMAITLLTPHLYLHDLAFLIVPCALVLKLRRESPSPLLCLSLILLGVLPILSSLFATAVPPIMPFILLAGFLWSLYSVRRAAAPVEKERPRSFFGWE